MGKFDKGAHSTRRGFLAYAGASATGVVAVMAPGVTSAATAGTLLTDTRRRTFTALVRTVGASPGTCVDPASAGAFADALDAYYRTATDRARAHVEHVLDALDDGAGGRFADLSARARHDRLATAVVEDAADGLTATEVRDAVSLAVAASRPRFRLDPNAADIWVRVIRSRSTALAA